MADMQTSAVKAFTDGWNAHDGKKVAAVFADGGVYWVAGVPALKGREAIQSNVDSSGKAFPDMKLTPWRTWQKDDVIAVEWVFNGTNSGDWMGMKATNKPVGVHAISLFWMNPDGSVKEVHEYWDGRTLMGQLGATKEKVRAVAAAPAGAPEMHVSAGTPDEAKNVDATKAMYVAFEKKAEADFVNAMTDGTEYDDYTRPATSKGKAEAKQFFGAFTKAFPDLKITPVFVMAVGDTVIAEAQTTGTNTGKFMGKAPTKKALDVKGVDVFQFKDGKVVRGWSYSNGMEVAVQLGLVKPPGAAGAKAADAKGPDAKKTDAKKADAKK